MRVCGHLRRMAVVSRRVKPARHADTRGFRRLGDGLYGRVVDVVVVGSDTIVVVVVDLTAT